MAAEETGNGVKTSVYIRAAMLFLLYFGGGWLGDCLSFKQLNGGSFSTFWPPSGIYMAMLFLSDFRSWPALIAAGLAGNLAVDLTHGRPFEISILFCIGNTLEAMAGAWLVRRISGRKEIFFSFAKVVLFVILSAMVSTMISATVGAAVVTYLLGAPSYFDVWKIWWCADTVGVLVFAPFIIAWFNGSLGGMEKIIKRRVLESLLFLFCILFAIWLAFGGRNDGLFSFGYIIVPILIWAAARFNLKGVSLANLAASVGGVWLTIRTGGEFRDFEVPLITQAVSLQVFLGVATFISLSLYGIMMEKQKAGKALKNSEEKFRLLFENSREGIAYFDIEGNIIDLNKKALELAACEKKDLVGLRYTKILEIIKFASDDAAEIMKNFFYGETADSYEWAVENKAGKKLVLGFKGSLVKRNDETIGFSVLIADISDRKQLEAEREKIQSQLFQSQKLESIGLLAGGVAHEFNNMIGIIMGSANMALQELKPEAAGRTELERISIASKRAKDITNSLLTYARQDKPMICDTRVSDLLKQTLTLCRKSIPRNIDVIEDINDDLPCIPIDVTQMIQAILNIINNASDAMPQGGRLTIEAPSLSSHENCPVCNEFFNSGKYLPVKIKDTGIGIAPDDLEKVFEPFFSTKEVGKGTGLGLSVTYGLIKNNNGHICLCSKKGEGTEVIIHLPLNQKTV